MPSGMSQTGNRNRWTGASCHASSAFPTSECIRAWRCALPASHPHSITLISLTTKRFVWPLHNHKCAPKELPQNASHGKAPASRALWSSLENSLHFPTEPQWPLWSVTGTYLGTPLPLDFSSVYLAGEGAGFPAKF